MADVSWQAYEAFSADLGDDFSGLRVHYLEGTLEITMQGCKHEVSKDNISRLLSAYFELGSTTFKREAKRRAAEPRPGFAGNLRAIARAIGCRDGISIGD